MIPDSVQYLGLFPMINRNQFWLPAPKHSSVCAQWEKALPCLGKEVQAVMGSDSHKRYSIMNASIFSFKTKFLIAF